MCAARSVVASGPAMECELVRLAGVPLGIVTSTLFYASDSGSQQAEVGGSSD